MTKEKVWKLKLIVFVYLPPCVSGWVYYLYNFDFFS